METLTKENFWDEMSQKYPKAMKHFLNWIDGYKESNNWFDLFTTHLAPDKSGNWEAPKYHELPIAMQFGIFLQWMCETSAFNDRTYNVTIAVGFVFTVERVSRTLSNFLSLAEEKL